MLKKINDRVLNCSQQTLTRSSLLWKNNNMLLSSQTERHAMHVKIQTLKLCPCPKHFGLAASLIIGQLDSKVEFSIVDFSRDGTRRTERVCVLPHYRVSRVECPY